MGLLPFSKTLFGFMPIFGNNVWFNALTAVFAGYYRNQGYQADVQYLRDQEFPELLTSFREFLEETNWANEMLTYQDI